MESTNQLLQRIADALDEQNRQNAEWIALQKHRYSQGDPFHEKIIAIHEANAAKDQAWRDLNQQSIVRFLQEQRKGLEHVVSQAGYGWLWEQKGSKEE